MTMKYENRIQLYSTANQKYPLDDFSEEDFPFNVLVDAAFSVPEGLMADMRLTTYIRKTTYAFVCVEAGTVPIGHLYVVNPVPYRIYPLAMRCQGTAWVVLGPASTQEMDLVNLDIPFDPACVLANPPPRNHFKIRVNGVEHPMPNIITVRTNNFMLTEDEMRVTDRDANPVRALTIRRNDLNLDEKVVRTALTDIDTEHMPITNINGVTPDENGNVTIKFRAEGAIESSESDDSIETSGSTFTESSESSQSESSQTEFSVSFSSSSSSSEHDPVINFVPVVERISRKNIGFVITTENIEGCVDPYIRLNSKIKSGKEGYGLPYDLPLDAYFESSSSSSSSTVSTSSSSEAPYSTVSSSSSNSSSSEAPYSTVSSSSSKSSKSSEST